MTALLGRLPVPARLIAMDSGSPDVGIADYHSGVLAAAHHVRLTRPEDAPCPVCKKPCRHGVEPTLVMQLCDEVERVLVLDDLQRRALGPRALPLPVVFVCEQPQIFQVRGGEGRGFERGGRSLFLICAVMAAMLDRAAAWGAQVYQYTPAVWKGPRRKDVHQMEQLARFTPKELQAIPRSARKKYFVSDALDAAALGRWWLEKAGYRAPALHALPRSFASSVEPVRRGGTCP